MSHWSEPDHGAAPPDEHVAKDNHLPSYLPGAGAVRAGALEQGAAAWGEGQHGPASGPAEWDFDAPWRALASQVGGGMDPLLRCQMESRFGEDFSGVQVQRGLSPADQARGVRAVAEQERIAVDPATLDGAAHDPQHQQVLAEELAHVVQKRRGTVTKDVVDEHGPLAAGHTMEDDQDQRGRLEDEAQTAAARVVAGERVSIGSGAHAPQRQFSLWGWVKDKAGQAANYVGDKAGKAADWVNDKIDKGTDWATSTIDKGAHWIEDKAGKATDWVGDKLDKGTDWIGDKANKAFDWTAGKVKQGASWVGDKVSQGASWLSNTAIGKAVKSGANWVGDKLGKGASWVGDKVNQGASWLGNTAIGKAVKAGTSWVGDKLGQGASWVGDKLGQGASWVGDKLGQGASWVGDKLGQGASWVGDKLGKGASWLGDKLGQGVDWLGNTAIGKAVKQGSSWLLDKAGGGLRWAGDKVGKGLDWLGKTPIGHLAKGLYKIDQTVRNTASRWVKKGVAAFDKGVDWVENQVGGAADWVASKAKGIPVLEQLANFGAGWVKDQVQFAGGVLKGAGGLVEGVANMVIHPLDTVKGLATMAEHMPGFLGIPGTPNPLKLMHSLYDVASGSKSMKDAMRDTFNPGKNMKDDAAFWTSVGKALIEPYKKSVDEGKPAEAFGRAAFEVLLLVGTGGESAAAKGGMEMTNVATKVEKVTELVNVANKAEKGTELANLASKTEKGTELANLTNQASKLGEESEAASTASKIEKAEEGASTASKAEKGPKPGSPQAEKSIRSLEKRISEHEKKLEEYLKNPDAYDNKGFLKDAPPEVRQRIIEGRERHLRGEIENFKKQIKELSGEEKAEQAVGAESKAGKNGEAAKTSKAGKTGESEKAGEAEKAGEQSVSHSEQESAKDAKTTALPDERKISTGPGRNTEPLTPEEVERATQTARELGMPDERILVSEGGNTSWTSLFGDGPGLLKISEDVKPLQATGKSIPANSQVSLEGAINHELVGHRDAELAGRAKLHPMEYYDALPAEERAAQMLHDNALEEAQASLRAAKFGTKLSKAERKVLFKDAMDRLKHIGKGVDDVPDLDLFLEAR